MSKLFGPRHLSWPIPTARNLLLLLLRRDHFLMLMHAPNSNYIFWKVIHVVSIPLNDAMSLKKTVRQEVFSSFFSDCQPTYSRLGLSLIMPYLRQYTVHSCQMRSNLSVRWSFERIVLQAPGLCVNPKQWWIFHLLSRGWEIGWNICLASWMIRCKWFMVEKICLMTANNFRCSVIILKTWKVAIGKLHMQHHEHLYRKIQTSSLSNVKLPAAMYLPLPWNVTDWNVVHPLSLETIIFVCASHKNNSGKRSSPIGVEESHTPPDSCINFANIHDETTHIGNTHFFLSLYLILSTSHARRTPTQTLYVCDPWEWQPPGVCAHPTSRLYGHGGLSCHNFLWCISTKERITGMAKK